MRAGYLFFDEFQLLTFKKKKKKMVRAGGLF